MIATFMVLWARVKQARKENTNSVYYAYIWNLERITITLYVRQQKRHIYI